MVNISENPPESVQFVVERNRVAKLENTARFFTELRAVEPISAIYYPAPGIDDSLSTVFTPAEIIYVNREKTLDDVTVGDFREIKLPSESQDVVFIQDIHEQPKDIKDFIRILKKGGLLVYSLYGCSLEPAGSAANYSLMKKMPELREEYLLKHWRELFRTFRKV